MVNSRPRLTPKGARTRARIVEAAAALIHERGVAVTTLEDVKVAAEVSGSQMYHYFPDKNELVQAVIDYQADTIVDHQRHTLSSADGVEAWRNMVITAARRTEAKGGCPLGSLGGQLAESDPEARALIAAGFDQWAAAIGDGVRSPSCRREAPVRHRPGRPRYYSARHAPRRTSTRPGMSEYSSTRNCGRYPPRPCHRQMSPSRGSLRTIACDPSTGRGAETHGQCGAGTGRDRGSDRGPLRGSGVVMEDRGRFRVLAGPPEDPTRSSVSRAASARRSRQQERVPPAKTSMDNSRSDRAGPARASIRRHMRLRREDGGSDEPPFVDKIMGWAAVAYQQGVAWIVT